MARRWRDYAGRMGADLEKEGGRVNGGKRGNNRGMMAGKMVGGEKDDGGRTGPKREKKHSKL